MHSPCKITIIFPPDLKKRFQEATEERKKYDINKKEIESYEILTEEIKRSINYIVTLGGDGTILWAAKQFNGDFVPPMITFSGGTLGFMCHHYFDDHP